MARNRTIPFGYMMQNGEITANPMEVLAVITIFSEYLKGKSLLDIAKQMDVPYSDGAVWNKHMVKRILENEKYLGTDKYPQLIDEQTFRAANEKKLCKAKSLCMISEDTEYYDLQDYFDDLYAKSKQGEVFTNLMEIISNKDNIRLAYRNIKRNSGSYTSGTDHLNIRDIERMSAETLIEIIQRKLQFYQPKPVKRVEIPKPNGKTRPLGIPTIVDRLVQQCILQVLEPICEAKFHERSNGFRPNRSSEHALAQCYRMIQKQNLHFVVDIDIKGFFDNVNHSKLIRQMWTMGIRDKQLICIIKQMLKAPIVMPDGKTIYPTKGTPQGGILSPLEIIGCVPVFMTINCPFGMDFSSSTVINGLPIICRDWLFSLPCDTVPDSTVCSPRALDKTSALWLFGANPPNTVSCVYTPFIAIYECCFQSFGYSVRNDIRSMGASKTNSVLPLPKCAKLYLVSEPSMV